MKPKATRTKKQIPEFVRGVIFFRMDPIESIEHRTQVNTEHFELQRVSGISGIKNGVSHTLIPKSYKKPRITIASGNLDFWDSINVDLLNQIKQAKL